MLRVVYVIVGFLSSVPPGFGQTENPAARLAYEYDNHRKFSTEVKILQASPQ